MEQANFDQLCSLVAAWPRVEGPKRRQLIDSLCSSLTCLNAWIDKLLASPPDAQNPDSVRQHRSAYKAYLFFLAWISGVAGREVAAATPGSGGDSASQLSQAVGGGRGRKKKAAAASGGVDGWDWGATFPKVVKAVAQALNTDLWALFRPAGPEEAMLIKAIQLVRGVCCKSCCNCIPAKLRDPAHLLCSHVSPDTPAMLPAMICQPGCQPPTLMSKCVMRLLARRRGPHLHSRSPRCCRPPVRWKTPPA